jgi:hypothetical protein
MQMTIAYGGKVKGSERFSSNGINLQKGYQL